MSKSSPNFTCTVCGAAHRKWIGKCEGCGAWNTLVEETPLSAGPNALRGKGRALHLTDLATPADVVSGSRYLRRFAGDSLPPAARRRINEEVTAEINERLGLALTDAFCGFKAYSRRALECLHVTETGYAMPLEVWVQAAAAGLEIVELPVPLVYLELARSFGGALDDAATRLAYYRSVLDRAEAAVAATAPGTAT